MPNSLILTLTLALNRKPTEPYNRDKNDPSKVPFEEEPTVVVEDEEGHRCRSSEKTSKQHKIVASHFFSSNRDHKDPNARSTPGAELCVAKVMTTTSGFLEHTAKPIETVVVTSGGERPNFGKTASGGSNLFSSFQFGSGVVSPPPSTARHSGALYHLQK
jgi:hypothetical protein